MVSTERRERAVALYCDLRSINKVALELGCAPSTVYLDLKQAGVEFVHTNRPQTEPRVCARVGCENIFRPTPRQVRAGFGKFCSRTCDHEAHRIHGQPDERVCARGGCEKRFTPAAYNVAAGWGKYCSRRCSALSTAAHQKRKGRVVECPNCEQGHWRYESQLTNAFGAFCSKTCWGRYRWMHGIAISDDLVSLINGRSRQRWKGRWNAKKPPAPGAPPRGRPRTLLTDAQREEIRRLHGRGWGRRTIASHLLISPHAVRVALAEVAQAS